MPMDDLELLAGFQSCALPLEEWCHRLHVRVAYLFLRRSPFEEAIRAFRSSLQAYNRVHQVPDHLTSGYHETLTRAWLTLVAARMSAGPVVPDSGAFCAAHPDLLDKSLLRQFYSAERIVSWEAKRHFVEPDLRPLPSDRSGVRESYLPVAGARLHLREVGRGRPLVVLHGGPDFDHHYLLPELDHLSSTFRLVYYDQRGRGESSAGVFPEDVSIDSEVADLDRVREHLELDAMSLLGHSWGGLLAMEYATRHPERVSHLILLNTAPASREDLVRFRERRKRTEAESLARMREVAQRPDYAAGDISAEAEYYRAHFRAAVRRPEHLEQVVRRLRAHFTPLDILKARAIEDRLYAQTWDRPGYDLLPGLRRLKAPTLVIHGEHDFVPLDCAKRVAFAVPGARLLVLKESGHFSYLDHPEGVLEAIEVFARHAGGG